MSCLVYRRRLNGTAPLCYLSKVAFSFFFFRFAKIPLGALLHSLKPYMLLLFLPSELAHGRPIWIHSN